MALMITNELRAGEISETPKTKTAIVSIFNVDKPGKKDLISTWCEPPTIHLILNTWIWQMNTAFMLWTKQEMNVMEI